MYSNLAEIAGCVRAFMRDSSAVKGGKDEFNRLAVELFSLQREQNAAYGRLCAYRNIGAIQRWEEIPAVPAAAFKQLELTSLPIGQRTAVFFSSGTTQQDRSRHFHSAESLALYEESLSLWFEKNFPPETERCDWVFLTPKANDAPNSSLAHMFGILASRRENGRATFGGRVDREGVWQLNFENVLDALRKAESQGRAVRLFGTAFLFVHLLDELEKARVSIRLPRDSWALETGGYKGRTREIRKDELHRIIGERLGVSRDLIFGEYGMSELSSQGYAGADGLFRFPPWARAQVISPSTGRAAQEGERGLIRVYDLANVWSVMAVQTEDVGVKVGDAFQLAGRAVEAEARGCSLMSA